MDSLLNLGFAFVHLFPYGTAQVNPFAIPQVVQTARAAADQVGYQQRMLADVNRARAERGLAPISMQGNTIYIQQQENQNAN
jgi:hypothetical protein